MPVRCEKCGHYIFKADHNCKEEDIKKYEEFQQNGQNLIELVKKEYSYAYQNNCLFRQSVNSIAFNLGNSIDSCMHIIYMLCEKINPCIPSEK